MSTRLASHGRLINRAKALSFIFNGKVMSGFEGDTLAASLLANDQMLMGRSFKYHRPRGVLGLRRRRAQCLDQPRSGERV